MASAITIGERSIVTEDGVRLVTQVIEPEDHSVLAPRAALHLLARWLVRRHMATNADVSATSGLPQDAPEAFEQRLDSSRDTSVHVSDD